jgi:hypothetical protein
MPPAVRADAALAAFHGGFFASRHVLKQPRFLPWENAFCARPAR